MAALVFADGWDGLFPGRFVGAVHGMACTAHVDGGLHRGIVVRELAAEQRHGRERLHGQGQHHENQQEASEPGAHAGSLAKRRNVTN